MENNMQLPVKRRILCRREAVMMPTGKDHDSASHVARGVVVTETAGFSAGAKIAGCFI